MARRNDIDWEAIQRDYRIGQLSVREIGRQHGVEASTITRKVKKEGWVKDAQPEVRARTRAALIKESNTQRNTECNNATSPTREDIAQAVRTNVEVVRQHRADISAGRSLVGSLIRELTAEGAQLDAIEEAIIEETKEDGHGKRRAAMLRAVSLPSRAGSIKDLSAAMKNLVYLERQAFNLDEKDDGDDINVDEIREGIQRRLAGLVARSAEE